MPLLRSSIRFYLCVPRVSYRALPSFLPGLCRSAALSGLFVVLDVCGVVSWYCVRCIYTLGVFACVGKCRSYGAQSAFVCVYPGFHIGLCPYSTLGFAGVSPLQGSLSYWAFAVLCRGIVFVVFIPLGHLFAWLSAALAGLFSFFYLRVPRVPYRALPLFHPGLCRSVALTGLFSFFYLRLPRVSYQALPSFHPGLCRSAALSGLIVGLGVCGVVSWYCVR